ncbi:adenylate cyclase type 1 [Silurus meridionalis]|nr:adenylate cyclase type 1 [Silurus meridionalis]
MEEVPFQKVRTRRKRSRHCPPGVPAAAIACEDEFDCKELESLFRTYNLKLEQTSALKALAVLAVLACALAALEALSGPGLAVAKASHPAHGVVFASLFVVANVKYLRVAQLQQIVSLALLFAFTFALLCCPLPPVTPSSHAQTTTTTTTTTTTNTPTPEQGVWQLALVTFVAYALLPVRTLMAVTFGIMVAISHIVVTATSVTAKTHKLWRAICARSGARVLVKSGTDEGEVRRLIMYNKLSVNLSGLFVRILTERAQRKAFLQARNCIEERLRMEDENEKQERLLMSLLPRNVAMEMKEDFLKPPERIFHKIYIQRHDNVRLSSEKSHLSYSPHAALVSAKPLH